MVLATPIESILSARPGAPPAGARTLAAPLTVSGLSSGTRRLLARAAQRSGRTVLAAPPGPVGGYPVQELVPGAAVAATLSTGDVSLGASGTVAYRDGNRIYAFGHSLEGLGPRTLFMQDAYVFGVIGNPLGVPDLGAITYKLTSSGGHPLGAITNDTFSAIFGETGPEPPSIPLRVSGRLRGGARETLNSRLADERELGLGAGLSFIAPLAASTVVDRLLGAFELVRMKVCTRIRVRGRRRPIGYCNPYFDSFDAFTDIADATAMAESFDLAPLDIQSVGVGMTVERGVTDELIVGGRVLRRARPGGRVPVRIALRRRGGGPRKVTVSVPIPRDARPGLRKLVIEGNGFPLDEEEFFIELIEGLSRASGQRFRADARAAQREPRSVRELARQVAALRQPLGITARLKGREPRIVLRSDEIRFDGRVRLDVRVLRRAGRRARR